VNNITTFELIAGISSILAIVLMIGTYTLNSWKSFKQKRENAEKEYKQMIDQLQATGGTIAARTDLGFFVLIELGSFRDEISNYRHHCMLYLIIAVFFLVMANLSGQSKIFFDIDILFPMIFAMIMLTYCIIMQVFVMRVKKYKNLFEYRINEVWAKAIDKRFPSKIT
jgi:glucose uptake protein GlcU